MNIYKRLTPRTDELFAGKPGTWREWKDADFHELGTLARRLEQELETCRDAHMANCLAADTLRREIKELRERYATGDTAL